MSDKNKNRYEVQKILIDSILDGLSKYIGEEHGFKVLEFAQASFVSGNRMILINPLRSKRIGWQGIKYKNKERNLNRIDEWIDEQSWQIHIVLKKKKSPQIDDLQSDDVAERLITYFNGIGVDFLREKEIAPLRIDTNSIFVYTDDSEIYQKRSVFTLNIQVPKELTIKQDDMTPKNPYALPNEYKSGVDKTESAKGFGHFPV